MKFINLLEKFIKGSIVLETVDSKINDQITVDEDLLARRRLLVDGVTQSGPAVEKIWDSAIVKLSTHSTSSWLILSKVEVSNGQIANCLILGLGAGNAAKVVNKYFPKAKITGIEIDPQIIKLGKKYFGLSKIKNLKIVVCDAISLVINHSPLIIGYDLILVDLYLGDYFPEKAESRDFLENLQKITKKGGIVIFNRLSYGKNKKIIDNFAQEIRKLFTKIELVKTEWNKLFLCRK